MEFYWITDKAKTLYAQYLTDRHQWVLINNTNSRNYIILKCPKIHHGVRQGSVLGSLFFLLCITDLHKIVNNTTVPISFADDTSILFANHNSDSLNKNINSTFQIVYKWYKANLLSLNYVKTQCTEFRTKNCANWQQDYI